MESDSHIFSRTEMILGRDSMDKLRNSRVVIFGIGGVGSYVAEALVRCGIENFVLVDHDIICVTNINRQIHALKSTVGRAKVEAMKERMLEINPSIYVEILQKFAAVENICDIIGRNADYVVDAIDTVTAKIAIVEHCCKLHIPVISSMGTGNKLHPERLDLADIYETSVCPLAKVMRKELRKRGIEKLTVCYSLEEPLPVRQSAESEASTRRSTPGSVSFVPSAAGMIIAGQVVRDLMR